MLFAKAIKAYMHFASRTGSGIIVLSEVTCQEVGQLFDVLHPGWEKHVDLHKVEQALYTYYGARRIQK